MDLEVLAPQRVEIVDEAFGIVQRSHAAHYESSGERFTRDRLAALVDLVFSACRERDLVPVVTYSERLAHERFNGGFDIVEVQTAFNAVEEAMWRRLVEAVPPRDLAQPIGLLSTVLGAAKDTLARTYVSLASQRHVPSLNLRELFRGTSS